MHLNTFHTKPLFKYYCDLSEAGVSAWWLLNFIKPVKRDSWVFNALKNHMCLCMQVTFSHECKILQSGLLDLGGKNTPRTLLRVFLA